MNYQDNWGFYTDTIIEGREVIPDPPPFNQWPDGQIPRWTGFEWIYDFYPPPELSQEFIEKLRYNLIEKCYAHAKELLDNTAKYWSDAEKATWAQLEQECLDYRNEQSPPGRFMQYEIDCGYRTADQIADRVLSRSSNLHPFRANVVAIRGYAIASILAMNAVDLYAVNVETDFEWPIYVN